MACWGGHPVNLRTKSGARRSFPIFLALCVTSVCALSLRARPGQAQSSKAAVLRTATNLVLVDVSVIGKDRKPVRGLSENDFRVFENGKA